MAGEPRGGSHSYQRLGREFGALRMEYRNGMPARLMKLGMLWSRLASGSAGVQAVADLLLELHDIAGSAGSHGLPQLGEAAQAAEYYLAAATARGARLGALEERHFNRLLGELRIASQPPRPRR